MVAVLRTFGLDGLTEPPPVSARSSREDQLAFCAEAEIGFEAIFAAMYEGLPPVAGVDSETITISGPDGNEIGLYVHRPTGATRPSSCVYHIHGGGMVILEAAGPAYVRWRDELAATGLVVVGVEYRNGGGKLGAPVPAGLEDCAAGLRWVLAHRPDSTRGRVRRVWWRQPDARRDDQGQARGMARRHRRCLRPVSVHLQCVGGEAR